jgi:hypothetical protein
MPVDWAFPVSVMAIIRMIAYPYTVSSKESFIDASWCKMFVTKQSTCYFKVMRRLDNVF